MILSTLFGSDFRILSRFSSKDLTSLYIIAKHIGQELAYEHANSDIKFQQSRVNARLTFRHKTFGAG